MPFLLCCGGRRSQSPTLFPPDSERMRTLHPPSLVSIALPSNTIPHRPSTGIDETQALRDIFGVSPSSHRGYQAAAKSSESFDTNFKFGHDSPARSVTKAHSPIRSLGHNIRQRLSQARLSTHSSRKSARDIKSTETVVHTKMLANNSQGIAGLDDLLASRNVSEGGYDSDARGIQTPSWTKASAGSFIVSPEYTAKVLNAFGDSPSKRSASTPRTPRPSPCNNPSPVGMIRTPSTNKKRHAVLQKKPPVQESPQIKTRATSTPRKPIASQRESFSTSLQLGPQESPSDVLHRLSVGLANGTIQLPDTPEPKTMRVPSIGETVPECRLSFAAPKRASSLHRCNPEVGQALKTLSNRIEKAKRDSATSDWTAGDKHVSLLSNLDPALLQYLSRFGVEGQPDQLHEATDHDGGGGKDDSASNHASDLDTAAHADTSGLLDIASAENTHRKDNSSSEDANRRKTGLQSEKESVHLFDMRISQRLASTSVFPTTYPSSTDLGSNKCHMDRDSQTFPKLDTFPGHAGQPSAEHLRRPSDPRTRRLFEPENVANGQKLHHRWKSLKSTNGFNPQKPARGADVSRDDASSVYLSDTGLEDGEVKSIVSQMARSNSLLNPSSVAIAGRHGAQSIPNQERRTSMGLGNSSEAGSKANLSTCSSGLMGKESKFSEEFDLDRKNIIRNMESEGANTIANERMSEADVMRQTRLAVDPNERMSEIDFAQALSNRLTASIRKQRGMNTGSGKATSEASREASQGTTSNDWLAADKVNPASDDLNADEEPARTNPRGREECATNMWERALIRAREEQSFEGSERSLRKSFSQLRPDQSPDRSLIATKTTHYHVPGDLSVRPARQSRSLSPGLGASRRSRMESFNLDKHQSLCAEAKKPLAQSTSPSPSIRDKKRSFLDIRRFTTAPHQCSSAAVSSPAAASPNRDLLAWARFPSHTRRERNGAAADKDGILTRDFSPPADKENSASQNPSKLSLMTQPEDVNTHNRGSWRFRKFGHGRKKSRSMNFPVPETRHAENEKDKLRKKSSFMTLTMSLARWRRVYRSHSGDLRRLKAGHRSSISKGEKVDFPALEIVPGFDGAVGIARKVRMEELGGVEEEAQTGRRRGDRDVEMKSEREKSIARSKTSKSKGPIGGSLGKKDSGGLVDKRFAEEETEQQAKEQVIDDAGCGSLYPLSGSERSSLNEPTPTKHRIRTPAAGAGGGENAWAESYRDCVVLDDDDDDHYGHPIGSDAHLLSSDDTTNTNRRHDRQVSTSTPGAAELEVEDSYISCSVGISDDHNYHDFPLPSLRSATTAVATGRDVDGNGSGSNGNGNGNGSGDSAEVMTVESRDGAEERPGTGGSKRLFLVSSELRDSTADFRLQLEGEERKVREELLRDRG